MEEAAARRVRVTLRYFDGCPSWRVAYEGLRDLGHEPELELVTTAEDAERLHFVGSPTILIDGRDPFLTARLASYGLTCRLFQTPDGVAGSPTVDQLREALTSTA